MISRDTLVAGIFLVAAPWAAFASPVSEPSIAGFAVGMDVREVERILESYAKKGTEIRRKQFGPSDRSTPGNIAEAIANIKVGSDCSEPRGTEKCEQITIFFARPDIGGKVRGVESVQFLPDATGTQTVIEALQGVYGSPKVSRSYEKKIGDANYSALGLLWGGETDRVESQDAFFPINASELQRIGGKYVFAELWQAPSGVVRRVRIAAGDDETNSRQAAAYQAEWDQRGAAERQRWRACVEQYRKEQREQPAATPSVGSTEEKRIFSYSGLGRVRFTIPEGLIYWPAVPHFTAGPRIQGGESCREQFEVSVYSYREPQTPAMWRAKMESEFKGRVPVQTLQGNEALLYTTQTLGKPDAKYRFVTYGTLAAGRALIHFEHHSNGESQARRDRMMKMVASAEFLDSDKWPSVEQLARDEVAWNGVKSAYESKDYPVAYGGARQLCDQWTVARADIASRAIAGNACVHAGLILMNDLYRAEMPDRYGASKALFEQALVAYGVEPELKEHRQAPYAFLAAIHGLGLGVPENLALARTYYSKEGTLESVIAARKDGLAGPLTLSLLEKLGL